MSLNVPTFPNYARPMTFEFWVQLPCGSPAGNPRSLQASSFGGNFLIYVRPDFERKGFATIDLFTGGGEAGVRYPTDGAWHHYMFAIECLGRADSHLRRRPAESITTITAGALTPNTSTALKFGNGFGALTGKLDEVRFSNVARPRRLGDGVLQQPEIRLHVHHRSGSCRGYQSRRAVGRGGVGRVGGD